MTSIVEAIARQRDATEKRWGRGYVQSVVLLELEKMAENFTRFVKKK